MRLPEVKLLGLAMDSEFSGTIFDRLDKRPFQAWHRMPSEMK
jgi:hypothetical protein